MRERGPIRRILERRPLRRRLFGESDDEEDEPVSDESSRGDVAMERLSLFSTKAKPSRADIRTRENTPISKQGEEAYCYTCIRDHLHKVQGLLREAEKQWTRDGKVTPGIRRKVALAESELSSAETEHVWNVQLDDPEAQKILDDIGSEISNIRKRLENTQIGFEHPGIPARGGIDDVKKAIADAGALKEQVYNAMVECPTCNLGAQVAERLKR